MWGSSGGQMKNNILRHPSSLESNNKGGFLGGNKKWNVRPASWAAPSEVTIISGGQRGNPFASVSFKFILDGSRVIFIHT